MKGVYLREDGTVDVTKNNLFYIDFGFWSWGFLFGIQIHIHMAIDAWSL